MNNYRLYFNTLKYLKGSQFYHRSNSMLKKKIIFKTKAWNYIVNKKDLTLFNSISYTSPINFECSNVNNLNKYNEVEINKLLEKEFFFLNKKVTFENEIGWNNPNLSQLWRYNLHYFNYFRDLIEAEIIHSSKKHYDLLKYYVKDWIQSNNKKGIGDGWHPYTISLRLVNWIFAYSAFSSYLDSDLKFKRVFLKSIISQVNFLSKNLEYDVVGNHLFENLKTLIITGLFLKDSSFGQKLINVGESKMAQQLSEQFLQDGGHFELSAMYHSILLKGLTELIYVYDNLNCNVPIEFLTIQREAAIYLQNVTHPDGEIPLFNDAAFGIADSPDYLKTYISSSENEKNKLSYFDQVLSSPVLFDDYSCCQNKVFFAKQSGYLKVEDTKVFSIIDFGKPCPDYLPAHAHADIFSYEISYNSSRLVVDTGTYEYSGSKRDADRATQSHNTLTINDENQSEVWGNFRVAERAFPKVHSFTETKDFVELYASHDGYFKKHRTRHYRKFIHVFDEVIIVLDYVETSKKYESYIHLSPNTTVELIDDMNLLLNDGLILRAINSKFSLKSSVYHPNFGVEENNSKIVVEPKEAGVFGYYYDFGNNTTFNEDDKISVNKNNAMINFDIRMENFE